MVTSSQLVRGAGWGWLMVISLAVMAHLLRKTDQDFHKTMTVIDTLSNQWSFHKLVRVSSMISSGKGRQFKGISQRRGVLASSTARGGSNCWKRRELELAVSMGIPWCTNLQRAFQWPGYMNSMWTKNKEWGYTQLKTCEYARKIHWLQPSFSPLWVHRLPKKTATWPRWLDMAICQVVRVVLFES